MFKRTALALSLLTLTSVTSASAAGKPKTHPTNFSRVAIINVTPRAARAHGKFTVIGRNFAPNQQVRMQMFCPQWGDKKHGYESWTVKSDARGSFNAAHHALQPIKVKAAICHLYALNVTKKGAAYASVELDVR